MHLKPQNHIVNEKFYIQVTKYWEHKLARYTGYRTLKKTHSILDVIRFLNIWSSQYTHSHSTITHSEDVFRWRGNIPCCVVSDFINRNRGTSCPPQVGQTPPTCQTWEIQSGADEWWETALWDDPLTVPYPEGSETSNQQGDDIPLLPILAALFSTMVGRKNVHPGCYSTLRFCTEMQILIPSHFANVCNVTFHKHPRIALP